jgi:hypothetical protein
MSAAPVRPALNRSRFATLDDIDAAVTAIEAEDGTGAATGFVGLPLSSWRITDANGAVGNIAAIGGVLASNSDPVLGAASGSQKITWAANSVVPIGISVPLPPNFNGAQNVTLRLEVGSGTTDAASIGVGTSWDGGASVADAADDSATKSATVHTVNVTIAAADVPDTAKSVTIILTPPAHATNAIVMRSSALIFSLT